MSDDSDDLSLLETHGTASILEQKDDLTVRAFEVFNTHSAMINRMVRGESNGVLYSMLIIFHEHFLGLYDASYVETESSLSKDDIKQINNFIFHPVQKELKKPFNSAENRVILHDSIMYAHLVFDKYEHARYKAGYRKTSYTILKRGERWRQNF